MIENLLTKLNPADLVEIGSKLEIFYKGEWGTYESGFFCGEKGKVSLDFSLVREVRLKAGESTEEPTDSEEALVDTKTAEAIVESLKEPAEEPSDSVGLGGCRPDVFEAEAETDDATVFGEYPSSDTSASDLED